MKRNRDTEYDIEGVIPDDTVTSKKRKNTHSTPLLSKEQERICDTLLSHGKDVIVSSVAGSGKTTVIIAAAEQLYRDTGKHSLIVTYSAALKADTREKVAESNYIHVESFHSLLYTREFPVRDDKSLSMFFDNHEHQINWKKYNLACFALVAFDEVQDAGKNEFSVMDFVYSRISNTTRLLFVGDPFQCIYKKLRRKDICDVFALTTRPPKVYAERTFELHRLSVSFRITPEIADAINAHLNPCVLICSHYPGIWNIHGKLIRDAWGEGIKSGKKSVPGSFTLQGVSDIYKVTDNASAFRSIIDAHRRKDTTCIFTSSTSTKKSTPTQVFLTKYSDRYNFHVIESGPDRKSRESSQLISADKIGIRTIFAGKGMQWDTVLHFGLSGYFEKKDPLLSICMAYTIWTRACQYLHVIYDKKKPFMSFRSIATPIEIPSQESELSVMKSISYVPPCTAVDDVVRHEDVDTSSVDTHLNNQCTYNNVQEFHRLGVAYFEDISPMVGIMVERSVRQKLPLTREYYEILFNEVLVRNRKREPHLYQQMNSSCITASMTVTLNTYVMNAQHLLRIIRDHDNTNLEYHKNLLYTTNSGITLIGEADFILDDSKVIELKTCKGLITHDQYKQVACYGCMYYAQQQTDNSVIMMYIINCITCEIKQVFVDDKVSFIDNVINHKLNNL
jgi:hypothetical protein